MTNETWCHLPTPLYIDNTGFQLLLKEGGTNQKKNRCGALLLAMAANSAESCSPAFATTTWSCQFKPYAYITTFSSGSLNPRCSVTQSLFSVTWQTCICSILLPSSQSHKRTRFGLLARKTRFGEEQTSVQKVTFKSALVLRHR